MGRIMEKGIGKVPNSNTRYQCMTFLNAYSTKYFSSGDASLYHGIQKRQGLQRNM